MSFLLSKAYLLFSGRMKSSFMLCSFKIFVTWSQPVFRYLWFHYNLSPCSKSLWVYSNVSRFLFFLSFLLLPSFLHSTDSNAKTFPCSLNLCCVLPLNKISVTKNLLKYSTTFLFFSSLFSSRSPQVLKSVKLCFPWLISLFSRITLGWALWVFYCLVVEWHHQLNGHEFKQALGDGEG